MSQRLIKPGLSALEFRIRNVRHIIGYTSRGPVWSIAGGAPDDNDPGGDDDPPDDDDSGDDDDSDNDSDDDDTDDGDKDDKDPKGKKKKNDDDDDEETVPKWKHDKLHTRMTAADRRASDLQKQLDDLKAGKDISEEVKRELADIKASNETLSKSNQDLVVKLAFFTVNTIDWEDAETALRLADLSDVDTDDKGNVDKRALKAALKELATKKPYLVKKKTTADGDSGTGKSGSQMNGRRKGQQGTSTREQLAGRFPVLNSASK